MDGLGMGEIQYLGFWRSVCQVISNTPHLYNTFVQGIRMIFKPRVFPQVSLHAHVTSSYCELMRYDVGAHSLHQLLHHASRLPDGQKAPFNSAILQSNAIL